MIRYNPVAGLTITEAISNSIKMAGTVNDLVEANINNVILYITPKSQFETYYKLYKKHIEQRCKHRPIQLQQKVR